MTRRSWTRCWSVLLAVVAIANATQASDCVFVAPDEANSAVKFGQTSSGTLIFEQWNDVSEDQSLCVYQPGWLVNVPDASTERFLPEDFPGRKDVQARMREQNVFTCAHSTFKGSLTFLSSIPFGPINIAVIDGHPYYEDCAYGR